MGVCNYHGNIYERLLGRCPPLTFPAPWGFLRPGEDCRGPVCDPQATLAALSGEFPDLMLHRAGVLEITSGGQRRLSPELTDPVGAVIALRDHPKRPPYILLTARGCLPRTHPPIWAVLADAWTAQRVVRHAVLFAAPRILDVSLLRAIGFPATLAVGISRLAPDRLRNLDVQFGGQDFVPAASGTAAPPAGEPQQAARSGHPEDPGFIRPTLALLGWSPVALAAHPAALSQAVAHLAAARRHLGLPLHGVMAWWPRPQQLDNLRFRLAFSDLRLVRELLWDSADCLADFEYLTRGDDAGTGECYAVAQAGLLAVLAGGSPGGLAGDVQAAKRVYDDAVQSDLVGPLQEWALQSDDPVVRSAGVELANVCGLMHRMSPLLFDLQSSQFERVRRAGGEPIPAKLFGQYLALSSRLGSLLRDLSHWRNA